MSNMPRTLPGAGPWWEARASLAFVERNLYLVRRYWHLELAFLVFNVASAMSVLYIGKAQMEMGGGGTQEGQLDLVLFLGIGTVVWAYLRAVFSNVGEMVSWERWEGTIEYTMMAPISRLAHMLGVSLFSIIYGLARSALLLGVLSLFFSVDLSRANRWVSRETGPGFTTYNSTQVDASWEIAPLLYWWGQYVSQERLERDWILRNSISWTPLQGGSLKFSFQATDSQDSRLDQLRRGGGANLEWRARPRLYLSAGVDKSFERLAGLRSWPLSVQARGYWTF